MGKPSAAFFSDDEIFADALTQYYTDYEPESCFVAESDGKVVGYILGAKDTGCADSVFARKIIFPLLIKALRSKTFLRKKNMRFLSSVMLSLIKGDFKAPHFSREYPATLHINLLEQYRAGGIGSRLIAAYLDYLKRESVRGVHFATMSERASVFFRKHNFQLLFEGKRSYFYYLLGRMVPIFIYGMRIRGSSAN